MKTQIYISNEPQKALNALHRFGLKLHSQGTTGMSMSQFPENKRNGKQIQEFVATLKENPRIIFTNSLYFMREVYLQGIESDWFNYIYENGKLEVKKGKSVDEIGKINLLDECLEQSDRYINHENKL